jgi:hypothetical protein
VEAARFNPMAIAVGLSPISIRNGAYCASPIHYHIVSSVKYRKALLDEVVTTIIQETAAEIAERFPMVGGGQLTDRRTVCAAAGLPREDLRQLRMY